MAAEVPALTPTPTPSPVAGLAKLTLNLPSIVQDIHRVFGVAVDISRDGGTEIVGVPRHTIHGVGSGGVYVFIKPGPEWVDATENARLSPSDVLMMTVLAARWLYAKTEGQSSWVPMVRMPIGESGGAYASIRLEDGRAGSTEAVTLTASNGGRDEQFGISLAINKGGRHDHLGGSRTRSRPRQIWSSVCAYQAGCDATETFELTNHGSPVR